MFAAPAAADEDDLASGTKCWYTFAGDGVTSLVTVLKVYRDDPPPYYTILMPNGVERNTVREKLRVATQEEVKSGVQEGGAGGGVGGKCGGAGEAAHGGGMSGGMGGGGMGGGAMGGAMGGMGGAPASARMGGGDDFGGFGAASSATQADMGGGDDFGGFGGAPSTARMGGGDDFGRFGEDFGGSASPAPPGASAAAGGAKSAGQFGGFGHVAGATPPQGDDEFGGFGGGFGGSTAVNPAGGRGSALAPDDFGGFGGPSPAAQPASDDFGGAGGPAQAPGDDDFGGFGGGAAASTQPSAMGSAGGLADAFGGFGGPTATSAAGGADDDDFGGFGGPTPPAGVGPAAAPSAADDFGGFSGVSGAAAARGAVAVPGDFGGFGVSSASPAAADDFGGFGGGLPSHTDDDFGGFGGPAAGGASTPAGFGEASRPSGDADFSGFGFGGAPAAPAASAPRGLGGGATAPSAGAAQHKSSLSADMFGGSDAPAASAFGGFGASVPSASTAAEDDFGEFGGPATDGAVGGDDFGAFGGPAAGGAPGGNAMGEDGFGGAAGEDDFGGFGGAAGGPDFGGFGGAAGGDGFGIASPSPQPFGSGGGVDLSGFGGARAPSDDFGDFGGFDGPAAPAAGGLPRLLGDDDDSFSSIQVRKPPGASPAVSPAPLEASGGFDSLLRELMSAGRYEEAYACRRHLDAVATLAVKQSAYEVAKENDELEEAIHLKKVVIPALKAKLQPEAVVAAWGKPVAAPYATLPSLIQRATQALGETEAAPFVRICPANLPALAASDVAAAATRLRRTRGACELLLQLPVARQKRQLEALDRMTQSVLKQMRAAEAALSAFPPSAADRAAAMRSPRVVELIDAMRALRKLGLLLVASRDWHASFFAASATAGRAPPDATAQAVSDVYRRAVTAAAANDDEAETEDVERYWEGPWPLQERCALSLAPLRSEVFTELPPSVSWEGQRFHAPCINFWVHNVDRQCPVF
jgi:hypothetical protein